jgi:hypothetical protein
LDFLVVPAFQVVLAFWPFRLSRSSWISGLYGFPGRSGFTVIPAFRSFQLSGRFSFPVVFLWSLRTKNKFKKEKRAEQFAP